MGYREPPSSDSVPRSAPGVRTEFFTEGEFSAVAFDTRNRQLVRLNPTASVVWSMVDGASTTIEIANEIGEIFQLDPTSAAGAVCEAIEEFRRAHLLAGAASLPDEAPTSQRLTREPDP